MGAAGLAGAAAARTALSLPLVLLLAGTTAAGSPAAGTPAAGTTAAGTTAAGTTAAGPQAAPGSPACRPPDRRSPLPPPDRALAAGTSGSAPLLPAAATPPATLAADYRAQLTPSPWGWVHLRRWCVWVEPAAAGGDAAAIRERTWLAAVEAALAEWQPLVRIERSDDPEAAQVRVWRRRPPLRSGPDGRLRASHGRAQLQLLIAESGGSRWIEPRVEVWIGPGQGPLGL
ncbi:MAG: hypothetical protein VKO65_02935, partial [Cyanobacteriota bacterium]|nr:hypothetical protein [Cyanobacteriota bacterium]